MDDGAAVAPVQCPRQRGYEMRSQGLGKFPHFLQMFVHFAFGLEFKQVEEKLQTLLKRRS